VFKSLLDYTKELEITATATQDFLDELRKGRRRLVNKIKKAEKDIAVIKNPDKYVKSILPAIEKDVSKVASDILQASILEAVRDNHEYDWPLYRRSLFLAAKDKDAFKIYNLGGSGFSTRLTFIVNFDKSAGRLEAWARGVKLTRKALEVKVPRKGSKKREVSALQASRAWGGIFGSRNSDPKGRFASTIKSRLSYSGQVAPFWQLLDKGVVPMASDRGGYPTPHGKPTNFIQRTQDAMEGYTRNIIQDLKANYDKLFADYTNGIEELNLTLERIDNLVNRIKFDIRAIDAIKQEYQGQNKRIDDTKVEKALQLIREGLAPDRIDIGLAGSRRTRPKTSRLAKIAGIIY
jgi:hypothetical protein